MGMFTKIRRRAGASPLRFALGATAIALALGVTGYLASMAVLWGVQARDLRETASGLTSTSSDRLATITEQDAQIEELQSSNADKLASITTLANSKAQAQDHQIIYEDLAVGFKECASERAKVLFYVERRNQYYVSSIQVYDNLVEAYCSGVETDLADTIAADDS